MDAAFIHYKLERSAGRMKMEIGSDTDLGLVSIRLGPFQKQPDASTVRINERLPAQVSVEHSGDSWGFDSRLQSARENLSGKSNFPMARSSRSEATVLMGWNRPMNFKRPRLYHSDCWSISVVL